MLTIIINESANYARASKTGVQGHETLSVEKANAAVLRLANRIVSIKTDDYGQRTVVIAGAK